MQGRADLTPRQIPNVAPVCGQRLTLRGQFNRHAHAGADRLRLFHCGQKIGGARDLRLQILRLQRHAMRQLLGHTVKMALDEDDGHDQLDHHHRHDQNKRCAPVKAARHVGFELEGHGFNPIPLRCGLQRGRRFRLGLVVRDLRRNS